jgi:hypothetical protein
MVSLQGCPCTNTWICLGYLHFGDRGHPRDERQATPPV